MTDAHDTAGQDTAARPRKKRRGTFWPAFLGALILANIAFDLSVVYIATTDPSFAVEKDYYQKGLHWDDAMSQERANTRLGWNATVTVHPSGKPGITTVVATLHDAAGAPLRDAQVTADVFHNARASEIFPARFAALPDGTYAAELPLRRPGLWEFRLRAERAGETYTATLTRELGARP